MLSRPSQGRIRWNVQEQNQTMAQANKVRRVVIAGAGLMATIDDRAGEGPISKYRSYYLIYDLT
jgi:hypothetical protein